MKNLKKNIFTLFILVLITSCSNDDGGSTNEEQTGGSNNANKTFVVGIEAGVTSPLPVLWINGVQTNLPTIANTELSDLKIVVQNNDVYVVGTELNLDTRKSSIVLWKNGVQSRFSEVADNVQIFQMIVDNGNVYVLGQERLAGGVDKFRYWKNGVATTIIDESIDVLDDFVTNSIEKMIVVNNDVYCIGQEFNAAGTIRTAKFWKNAVPTTIADFKGNFDSLVDIQVNGTDVSILYNQVNPTTFKPEVKLWKNNVITVIGTGENGFSASGMVIKDGVEHILMKEGISFDGSKLLYLKNRVTTEITDGTSDVGFSWIKVDGSNVCVVYEVGFEDEIGFKQSIKYWLNGATKTVEGEGIIEIQSVFLAGKDVYITSDRGSEPKLWVNGAETILKTKLPDAFYRTQDVFVTQ